MCNYIKPKIEKKDDDNKKKKTTHVDLIYC